MKKIVYFIPAIIFTTFFVYIAFRFNGVGTISPIVPLWIGLFIVSGILLSKKIFFGALAGIIPAIHIIYMGATQYRQHINEMPIGIIVLIFYIFCGGFVFYKTKEKV